MIIKNQLPKFFGVFLFMAIFILIPLTSFGQDTVVKGVITDVDGNPIPDVKISFYNPDRGLKFHVQSDDEGKFIKAGIIPTVYRVTIEKDGYFSVESQARIRFGFTEEMEVKLRKVPPKLEDDKNLNKGIDLFSQGKYDEAIETFKKVIEKFPDSIEGYYNLGLSYLRKGDIDQAIASFETAAELNPKALPIFLALGESYFGKGENEKAEENYLKAIEIDPENPNPRYNLGMVYYKSNKTEEALLSFDKCIELAPENSTAHYQAGLASIKHGDFERAIEYFETFLKLEPNAPEAGQVKAIIEELKKNIQD
ncbi:MAG: tetratricopeptide repeat protein [Candidatus Aminicenantes bacterium]|nr:tetratricopeptide repeat protein [Candidatus Aminicenantes bacterium]